MKLTLQRVTQIKRDSIFKLSTDIEGFSKLMPKYFKSLIITNSNNSDFFVLEKISFLGKPMMVKTKHVILPLSTHEIHILSGPLKYSTFHEIYEESRYGTSITIHVNLQFNGMAKFLLIFNIFLKYKIKKIMDEFIKSCEIYQFSVDSN